MRHMIPQELNEFKYTVKYTSGKYTGVMLYLTKDDAQQDMAKFTDGVELTASESVEMFELKSIWFEKGSWVA